MTSYKTTSANRGCCAMNANGCQGCCSKKQSSYDWLCDIPEAIRSSRIVEVQFKNTRKGYYLNDQDLDLKKGDLVAVEASPGHDIGEVSLVGKLVELAMKKHRYRPEKDGMLQVYRLARPSDLERWEQAKAKEEPTMIQTREIAARLGLEMKIGDVEYQGDGNKAIFYYIADGRVDFRQLIRVLADTFHIKVEMKQIGARQEAGRIGGIGPCGRELCCSSWMSNFVSVNTSAARVQDLSLNPQKLTGLCGKLKCCMNYEVQAYTEAQRSLPSREVVLETRRGNYHHFKTDSFQRQITYSTSPSHPAGLVTISAKRAFEVISMNKQGEQPDTLEFDNEKEKPQSKPLDILSDNSLTRFDKKHGGGKPMRKSPKTVEQRPTVPKRRELKGRDATSTPGQTSNNGAERRRIHFESEGRRSRPVRPTQGGGNPKQEA